MDNRPIGVFDSGLGGLTTVRQLRRLLPGESIVYFGDTGRVPYGTKSRDTLIKYARQDIRFLLRYDPKAVVVACNTADTVRSVVARDFDIPVLGVLEPAAKAALKATRNGRIALIATESTIRSGAYDPLIREAGGAELYAKACPLFVPLVENGRTRPGDPVLELLIEEYLTPVREWGCDTLILGCTHYPLLTEAIGRFMGSDTVLINSGSEAAKQLAAFLSEGDLCAENGREGDCRFFVSDSPEGFTVPAERFLGETLTGSVEQVEIGEY